MRQKPPHRSCGERSVAVFELDGGKGAGGLVVEPPRACKAGDEWVGLLESPEFLDELVPLVG